MLYNTIISESVSALEVSSKPGSEICLDVPVKNAWCGLMQGVSSSTMENGG